MINFTTDLLPINPAYNDSIIRYQSTITGMTKSNITISGNTFSVYPFDNTFSFNLKEIAKTWINPNGFEDTILPDLNTNFIYNDNSLTVTIPVQIQTMNNVTGDTIAKNYKFSKSVVQLKNYSRKLAFNNDVKLLLPTENNFDYSMTYFEGYPADFGVLGVKVGDTFYFRNTNTGLNSNTFSATTTSVKRIFLSDGATDSTINDIILMSSNVNHLELYVNGVLKANLKLKKVESKCGVYLKWFSSFGCYSYWLFESVFKDSIKTKDLGEFSDKWDNLQNKTSTTISLGKSAAQSYQLNTNYDNIEKEYLIDILKSPSVQIYTHQTPFNQFTQYDFLGVNISDLTATIDNKTRMNKLKISVEQPDVNTITY